MKNKAGQYVEFWHIQTSAYTTAERHFICFCTFTSSKALITIHSRIVGPILIKWNKATWELCLTLLSNKLNPKEKNIFFVCWQAIQCGICASIWRSLTTCFCIILSRPVFILYVSMRKLLVPSFNSLVNRLAPDHVATGGITSHQSQPYRRFETFLSWSFL